MAKKIFLLTVMFIVLVGLCKANAGNIDVLWYTGGVGDNLGSVDYKTQINNLIPQALAASGNTWTITYWDSGPMPAGTFNVLVEASGIGGWSPFPNYSSFLANVTAGTFGDRVLVTGQDTDWHYINGPGKTPFDGPQGWLVDAINWAGSGTGMGGVLMDAVGNADTIFTGLGTAHFESGNDVVIPGPVAGFPINVGLTSGGLSNWESSFHMEWSGPDTSKWTGINIVGPTGGDFAGDFITEVTATTASGGTGGSAVPEPATMLLLGSGLIGLVGYGRKKFFKK